MKILLKGRRSYTFAAILAIALHAALGYGLWSLKDELAKLVKLTPPSLETRLVNKKFEPLTPVQTSLIIEQPAPAPVKKTAKPKPKKTKPKPKKIKPKKVKTPTPAKPETKPEPEPEPEPVERDLEDLLDKIKNEDLLEKKPASDAPDESLSPEMRVASRFVNRIQRQVEAAWIQPPNVQYRDMAGLQVLIRLTLKESGKLVNARILSSSGNPQFDRSAINAVYKVGHFEVPSDKEVFNKFFRQVNINYSL